MEHYIVPKEYIDKKRCELTTIVNSFKDDDQPGDEIACLQLIDEIEKECSLINIEDEQQTELSLKEKIWVAFGFAVAAALMTFGFFCILKYLFN